MINRREAERKAGYCEINIHRGPSDIDSVSKTERFVVGGCYCHLVASGQVNIVLIEPDNGRGGENRAERERETEEGGGEAYLPGHVSSNPR